VIRPSTVSPFDWVGPVAAGLCGAVACASWIAASAAVSARAAVSGLASIVAPISTAIATERAKGPGIATGWMKDDMGAFLFQPRLSFAPPGKEIIADIDNGLRVEDEGFAELIAAAP
jgi:hypothetical protein